MRKSLIVLVIIGTMSGPAVAQTAPAANPAETAKPKMVKKVVCQRADDEETTGSRLGSAPRICKTVLVPAPKGETAKAKDSAAPANATGNNL